MDCDGRHCRTRRDRSRRCYRDRHIKHPGPWPDGLEAHGATHELPNGLVNIDAHDYSNAVTDDNEHADANGVTDDEPERLGRAEPEPDADS